MAGRLRDKVALITGAGSGIGAATAVVFAQEGAKVALADLRPADLETVAAQVKSAGGEALVMVGDVTRRADSQRLVEETVKRFGRADVLVNSAGVAPRNAAEQMVKQGGGSIVNLSSIYGLVGRPREIGTGLDPYTHSKGGVVQLTRYIAVHFAREGVLVNALCPGFVYTNLTKALTDKPESRKFLEDRPPMGRLGQPDEIARAALFLASDDASFVTGACLPVDGGYTAQ